MSKRTLFLSLKFFFIAVKFALKMVKVRCTKLRKKGANLMDCKDIERFDSKLDQFDEPK